MTRLEQLQHAKQDARDSVRVAEAMYYASKRETEKAHDAWQLAANALMAAQVAYEVEMVKESEAVARIGQDLRGLHQ